MKKVIDPGHGTGQRADRRALAHIDNLIDAGVLDAASVLAWEVQRESPADPIVWLLLARIDYLRERFAAAMYAARMATRLDPGSSEAWLALAMTAVTRTRWRTEGLDAALQATALAPDDPRTWTVLSQLHLIGGAVYEAAVAAEEAIRADPDDRGGHLMLGETALEAGELTHAEAAFRRVLELDADDPDGRAGLVDVLEARGVDTASEPGGRDGELDAAEPEGATHPPVVPRDVASARRALSDAVHTQLRRQRVAVLVFVSSIGVGLVAGLAAPGLGVVRGLVGGVAVGLMWIAVRPLRSVGPTAEDREEAGGEETVAAAPTRERAEAPAGDRPPVRELPDAPELLAELSRRGLAAGDVELAHAAASRLEAVAPGTIATHRALAAVALAEQDYPQARLHYQRVLELEPLDQEAHQRLALMGDEPGRVAARFQLRGLRGRR